MFLSLPSVTPAFTNYLRISYPFAISTSFVFLLFPQIDSVPIIPCTFFPILTSWFDSRPFPFLLQHLLFLTTFKLSSPFAILTFFVFLLFPQNHSLSVTPFAFSYRSDIRLWFMFLSSYTFTRFHLLTSHFLTLLSSLLDLCSSFPFPFVSFYFLHFALIDFRLHTLASPCLPTLVFFIPFVFC